MRVLLDEGLPARLKKAFPGHSALTVPEAGWRGIKNGQLLRLAEKSFDVFITVDKAMERENELSSFRLGFVIIHVRSNRMVDFKPILSSIAEAIGAAVEGSVVPIRASKSEHL